MSVITNMLSGILQRNEPVRGLAGAQKSVWIFVDNIDVAIYKNDSYKSYVNAKYENSTHSGLTFWKGFEYGKEYCLVIGMEKYDITYFNESEKTTTLLLKQAYLYE